MESLPRPGDRSMAELMPYVMGALADEAGGADAHVGALEMLCEILVFAHSDTLLAVVNVDHLAKRLPALVSADQQGDVPFQAARAIAEAVEILPQWAENFLEHGAVQALRDRLLAVDNIELAEEIFLIWSSALAVSASSGSDMCIERPDECLRLGVAAAVLQSFSERKQKVALNILAVLFEDCDEADVPKAMEALSALYNLLQSADKKIRKAAISFLRMFAAGARRKAEHTQ